MVFRWFALGNEPEKTFEFRCEECGRTHRGSPSFSSESPLQALGLDENQVAMENGACIVDDDEFYIHGLLEVPIVGAREPFTWGLWVSQSQESYERYVATCDQDQSEDGSFGWLAVTMPGYNRSEAGDELELLACNVFWRDVGLRPLIVPKECDHPLYYDVTNGISWDRAIELARLVMHSKG